MLHMDKRLPACRVGLSEKQILTRLGREDEIFTGGCGKINEMVKSEDIKEY